MNREFLMLAKTYDPTKHLIGGWVCSTKYDGQRCLWDGGVSRGVPKKHVPWANTQKDARFKEEVIASGLWSRYGNVIHAPPGFLDRLPKEVMLDGELWAGRGNFQRTRKIISRLVPDATDWQDVRFFVFELPPPEIVFKTGRINNPNWKDFQLSEQDCVSFFREQGGYVRPARPFDANIKIMEAVELGATYAHQEVLPFSEVQAKARVQELLEEETALGGEGLMLRNPISFYSTKRSPDLLKVKKLQVDEGTVVGYTWGQGKLEGLMGAAVMKWEGKSFELSGFTDAERTLRFLSNNLDAKRDSNGGQTVQFGIYNPTFPIGSEIRFCYADLTDAGLPRNARYWRK